MVLAVCGSGVLLSGCRFWYRERMAAETITHAAPAARSTPSRRRRQDLTNNAPRVQASRQKYPPPRNKLEESIKAIPHPLCASGRPTPYSP